MLKIYHLSENRGKQMANDVNCAFYAFRKSLAEKGFYKPACKKILFELSLHLLVSIGGLILFVLLESWYFKIPAILLSTIGTLGVSTNTHTASHYATSKNRTVNKMLTYFGYPFFVGVSAVYWWHKHVTIHHPNPNIVEADGDIEASPWFICNKEKVAQKKGVQYFYYQYIQKFIFPFVLSLNAVSIIFDGIIYLIRRFNRRNIKYWIDLGCLVLHFSFFIIIPCLFFPIEYVLGVYALRVVLLGYAIFIAFAPAHFPKEAELLDNKFKGSDFSSRQISGTINFRAGYIGNLICSGVDYQIEHHLFPNISHVYYPKLSKLVKEYCHKHGYEYKTIGWAEGVYKSLKAMFELKDVKPYELKADREGKT